MCSNWECWKSNKMKNKTNVMVFVKINIWLNFTWQSEAEETDDPNENIHDSRIKTCIKSLLLKRVYFMDCCNAEFISWTPAMSPTFPCEHSGSHYLIQNHELSFSPFSFTLVFFSHNDTFMESRGLQSIIPTVSAVVSEVPKYVIGCCIVTEKKTHLAYFVNKSVLCLLQILRILAFQNILPVLHENMYLPAPGKQNKMDNIEFTKLPK